MDERPEPEPPPENHNPTDELAFYTASDRVCMSSQGDIESMDSEQWIEMTLNDQFRETKEALPRKRTLSESAPGAPEGVWRLAQDFRELNKTTVINYFGLPDPMDMAINMAGSEYISELVLASACWQIQIAEEDRYKTAFMLPDGRTFQSNVAPMGLNTSGMVLRHGSNQGTAARLRGSVCRQHLHLHKGRWPEGSLRPLS